MTRYGRMSSSVCCCCCCSSCCCSCCWKSDDSWSFCSASASNQKLLKMGQDPHDIEAPPHLCKHTNACACVSVSQSTKTSKWTEKSLEILQLLQLFVGTFCQLLCMSRPLQLTCIGRHSWSPSCPSRTYRFCPSTSASPVTSQAWSDYSWYWWRPAEKHRPCWTAARTCHSQSRSRVNLWPDSAAAEGCFCRADCQAATTSANRQRRLQFKAKLVSTLNVQPSFSLWRIAYTLKNKKGPLWIPWRV